MRFILWGTLAALLAFNVYSEGTPEDTQDNEQDQVLPPADAPAAADPAKPNKVQQAKEGEKNAPKAEAPKQEQERKEYRKEEKAYKKEEKYGKGKRVKWTE